MRIKLWPKATIISVDKCNHRYGAKMTFSQQTDTIVQNSIYAVEMYGFKNNVRLGAFVANLLPGSYVSGIKDVESTGLIRHDIYFCTDYWRNPTTGVIEVIPDYYGTTWTSAGAAAFGTTIGTTKTARSPSHGQGMYDLTAGQLGYDYVHGIMGASNLLEVTAVEDNMQNWLFSLINRYASTASYRVGDNKGWYTHLKRWCGFRNSSPSPTVLTDRAITQYGNNLGYPAATTTRTNFINYNSSFRWWDAIYSEGKAKADVNAYMVAELNNTISNAGWYRDFCHWHSAQANNSLPSINELLALFRTTVGSNFVWTCSNGEAIEYMFVRELCKRITAVDKDGKITVIVDIVDNFKDLLTMGLSQALRLETINIPLSAKIDLTGTSLAGKNIISNYGKIVSLGSNQYIIQIPFNQQELFQGVILQEGSNGYFVTTIPTATKATSGNVLTITTNIPTKAVLYAVATGGNDYDSQPVSRSNTFKNTHTFMITSGNDYRAGIISEFGQANLITI